jgi:hypothetical protein
MKVFVLSIPNFLLSRVLRQNGALINTLSQQTNPPKHLGRLITGCRQAGNASRKAGLAYLELTGMGATATGVSALTSPTPLITAGFGLVTGLLAFRGFTARRQAKQLDAIVKNGLLAYRSPKN